MSDPRNWSGFEPDTSPLPDPVTPRKSPQEQLDDLAEQIATLEKKREELQYAIAKEEVQQEVKELKEDLEKVQDQVDEADEDADEAWRLLREFGSHTAPCLSGALTGSQKLQPLCTCGWNEVATRIERGG